MDPHLITLETGTCFDSGILYSLSESPFDLNDNAWGISDLTIQEILQQPINLN